MDDEIRQRSSKMARSLMVAVRGIRMLPESQRMAAFIETWDQISKAQGAPTFREVLQLGDKAPVVVSQDVVDVAQEMVDLTTDNNPGDVMRRALGTYAAIVRHVARGGRVRFEMDGEETKTLKVRVKSG